MAMGVKDNDASFSRGRRKEGCSLVMIEYDQEGSAQMWLIRREKRGLLVVMSLRSGLLETEDAGCSLPPLYNGAVFTGVGRMAGGLGRKSMGGRRRERARDSKVHCIKSRE